MTTGNHGSGTGTDDTDDNAPYLTGAFAAPAYSSGSYTPFFMPAASFASATASVAAPHEQTLHLSAASMTLGVPTDPYLNGGSNSQWHLIGTWGVHADKVWTDYTGAGIVLADLDDGFQTTHPDLSANISTALSYNFVSNTTNINPAAAGDNHGTAVMGVMIADDNNVGTVGVAFDATGVGIVQGFGANGTLDQTLNGFQWALTKHVDVMNNSWGFTAAYSDDAGINFSGTDLIDITGAMKNLADQGRGGLGTEIVFSAGNSRTSGDNTNYHNMQDSPYSITVGAIDSSGHVASFSTPGTSILVAAGGVSDLTTDRTGTAGYSSTDYSFVNGTSFSAPTVSGVVGLMLQANHNLGWRDVQEILAYSTQHNDSGSAGWAVNGANNANGGGLYYSSDYGFGAVNALAAVRLAETWTTQHMSANMVNVSGGTVSPGTAFTGGSTITSTINVSQNVDLEHVLINMDISASHAGHLIVTLIAPDGTQSVLVNQPANGSFTGIYGVTGIHFQASTVADWGENSVGTWTLKVQDTTAGETGTLNSWGLTLMGSTPTTDDTYIFTDTFATFTGAALTARSIISDANGGIDTLNLAAMTSDSIIDLTARTGIIAGKAVTVAAGTVIENIYGGDGNDTITGNAANNHLYGGRGNDTLQGGAGNDTIDGGAGNDIAIYNGSVSDFTFNFIDIAHVNITDTLGTLGTDIVSNVENFSFLEGVYTVAALMNNLGATPSIQSIAVAFGLTSSKNYTFNSQIIADSTLTAGNMSYTGSGITTGMSMAEVVRDSSGIAINYLNAKAPHILTLSGSSDGESITISGVNTGFKDTINAGAGNDTVTLSLAATSIIHGNDGNDVITVFGGTSTVYGDAGNDIINGGSTGANTLYGGDGNDVLNGSVLNDKLYGGNDDDTINGGNGNDTINGDDGNDIIDGGAGNDTINGGLGDDTIHGSDGNDTLHGGGGNDIIYGDAGNDKIYADANSGNDFLYGGDGNDTITGGKGNDTMDGGDGNDVIHSGGGSDTMTGGAGNDTLYADSGSGDTVMSGGDGNDVMTGNNGNDTLDGGTGNDTIHGGNGNDTITGFDGNDNITGDAGNDIISGGAGNDTINGGAGNDVIHGDDGNDTIHSGGGNDMIYGDAGDDKLYSDGGVTTIYGGDGNDTITGGTGIDTLYGDDGNDIIHGNSGNDILTGGDGNDILYGDAGNDLIIGGAGTDTLYGGTGADIFGFTTLGDGVDTIKDFVYSTSATTGDKLNISDLLTGFTVGVSDISQFVLLVQQTTPAKQTLVEINATGDGDPAHFVQAFIVAGTSLSTHTATDLLASGVLIVDHAL